MSRRTFRRASVALLAGAGLVPLGAAQADPPARSSQGAALSLGVVRDAQLGNAVRVSGRLTATPTPGGQQVQLVGDAHPFDRNVAVATTTTQANGTYAFTVRPQRNTRFQATAAGATSRVGTVYVIPRISFGIYNRPGNRLEVRAVITGVPPIAQGDKRAYFYFVAEGSTVYRRVAARTLARPAGNVLRAVALVPRPRSDGSYLVCGKDPFIVGMGRPFRFPGCGSLTFTGPRET